MRATLYRALALLACALAGLSPLHAEEPVAITTTKVADKLYMLVGRGGNVAVSVGNSGTFVVDDQYAPQYGEIMQAVSAIDAAPVKFLINTHWHSDHAGGNEQMGSAGAAIVAHENVRTRLSSDQVIEFFNAPRPASPAAALPVITFAEDITFHVNGDTVHIFHVANAHTDGDSVVHFQNANVIHTGDVFFNGFYPFIDSGTGGSIAGIIAAGEKILSLADDSTKIIPGHGPLSDKTGLADYVEMLREVQNAIAALVVAGSNEEQIVLAKPTAAFDAKWGGGFLKADTFVRLVVDNIKRRTLR